MWIISERLWLNVDVNFILIINFYIDYKWHFLWLINCLWYSNWSNIVFTRESSYCFQHVLAITVLSVHLSVCLSICSSHGWNEIGPRLLLITNRKSYTGSRLAPNSMTLNDFQRQNRGFYGFFGDFELRHKSLSFTRWRHAILSLCNPDREFVICILT